jgi:hypothetical protein
MVICLWSGLRRGQIPHFVTLSEHSYLGRRRGCIEIDASAAAVRYNNADVDLAATNRRDPPNPVTERDQRAVMEIVLTGPLTGTAPQAETKPPNRHQPPGDGTQRNQKNPEPSEIRQDFQTEPFANINPVRTGPHRPVVPG